MPSSCPAGSRYLGLVPGSCGGGRVTIRQMRIVHVRSLSVLYTHHPTFTRMRLLLATLLLLSTACADGTRPMQAEGEYVLQNVNDTALPYTWTYPATSSSYTVRSQRITILSGGAWTSSTSHVFVYPGLTRDETNHVDGGTYTFDGSTGALVLRSDGAATVRTGSVSGRLFTITNDADRLVYER